MLELPLYSMFFTCCSSLEEVEQGKRDLARQQHRTPGEDPGIYRLCKAPH